MRGRLVAAGGLNLWVEQGGAGTAVLLIAGLGYASWCWHELRSALGTGFALTSFDNRGAGRSDKPAGPYSIAALADDAAAVLGTSPGGPDTQPVPEETLNVWKLAGKLPPAEYARRSMPRSFAPGWSEANPDAFERILARRLEFPTPAASWLAQYQACVDYVARGVDASRIDAPALVIHGRQDRVVPHVNGELLARRLPRSRFVSLPEAGHLPFLENPAGFAGLVRDHLR